MAKATETAKTNTKTAKTNTKTEAAKTNTKAAKTATKPAEVESASSFTTDSLVRAISEKSTDANGNKQVSITQATEYFGYLKDAVADALREGKKVQLTGFFTITPSYRESHEGNNVMTGEPMTIPESVVFNAKVGKGLKDVAKELPAGVVDSLKKAKEASKK